MKKLRVLAILSVVAAVATAASAQEPFRIALRFVSDTHVRPSAPARMSAPFAIGQVTDARGLENPMVLGESQAKSLPKSVEAVSSVPEFVNEALRTSLAEWNANVSPDASLVLNCQVLKFSVFEHHRVEVDVRFRIQLEDREGNLVWQTEVANEDGVWGRSLSESNYSQAFSTATKRAFADLFDSTGFRAALTE